MDEGMAERVGRQSFRTFLIAADQSRRYQSSALEHNKTN